VPEKVIDKENQVSRVMTMTGLIKKKRPQPLLLVQLRVMTIFVIIPF